MTHELRLVRGSSTINLTDNTVHFLLDYEPRTPNISAQELETLQDGGELVNAKHLNVTESARVDIKGTDGADVQTKIRDIEDYFESARFYQDTGRGDKVEVRVRMDSDTTNWFSEVLNGRVELVDNVWDLWSNNRAEVIIIWTRRFYWWSGAAQLWKSANGVSRGQGSVNIVNVPGENYVHILGSDVAGVLPGHLDLTLENQAGSSINLRNIYIAQYVERVSFDNTDVTLHLEGEENEATGTDPKGSSGADGTHDGANNASVLTDSTKSWTTDEWVGNTVLNFTDGSSGTITANTATTVTATLSGGTDNDWDSGDKYAISSASHSNGFYQQTSWTGSISNSNRFYWTIPAVTMAKLGGRYFRVMARIPNSPPTDTFVKMMVKFPASTRLTTLYESDEIKIGTERLQDFGVVQLPPALAHVVGGGEQPIELALTVNLRSGATDTLDIDFLFLMPLDGWRHIKQPAYQLEANEVVTDDEQLDATYTADTSGNVFPLIYGLGDRIKLFPGRDQRLYVLHDISSGMNIAHDWNFQAVLYTRRITL